MAFISASFSNRKIQSRRFTGLTFDSQEAFTSVLDVQGGDVLTDDRYIPTSSLLFSGSSQHNLIVSRSNTDTSIIEGSSDDGNVLKYFFRHKLTRAANAGIANETFYFLKDEPSAASDAVSSDGLVSGSQLTDFINNKNALGSLGAGDAENIGGNGLAYNVVVFKSTDADKANIDGDDKIDAGEYVFDYKTGILTFLNEDAIGASEYIYMTAYRYVGRTLKDQIEDGSLGGSGFPFSGSAIITGSLIVSSSVPTDKVDFTNTIVSGSTFSGSFVGDGTGLTGLTVDANTVNLGGVLGGTANAATFTDNVLSGSGADNQVAIFNGASDLDGSSNLTFDGQTLTVSTASITTNLTVGGNLTVQGTTTTIDSTQIELGDRILVLNAALGGGSGNAGINVHVSASDGDPAAHTGSFLWDDDEQYWKGGVLDLKLNF